MLIRSCLLYENQWEDFNLEHFEYILYQNTEWVGWKGLLRVQCKYVTSYIYYIYIEVFIIFTIHEHKCCRYICWFLLLYYHFFPVLPTFLGLSLQSPYMFTLHLLHRFWFFYFSVNRAKVSTARTMNKMRGQTTTSRYPQVEAQLGECFMKHSQDLGEESYFGINLSTLSCCIWYQTSLYIYVNYSW